MLETCQCQRKNIFRNMYNKIFLNLTNSRKTKLIWKLCSFSFQRRQNHKIGLLLWKEIFCKADVDYPAKMRIARNCCRITQIVWLLVAIISRWENAYKEYLMNSYNSIVQTSTLLFSKAFYEVREITEQMIISKNKQK